MTIVVPAAMVSPASSSAAIASRLMAASGG
jgi:hypothetical protein